MRALALREEAAAAGPGGVAMGGAMAGAHGGAGATGPGGAMARPAAGDPEFAETAPVIQALTVDPAGRLWLRRAGAREYDRGPVDIVAADGRYVGTLPEGSPLPAAFGPDRRAADHQSQGGGGLADSREHLRL
jgi:hypothetical protein